MLVVLTAPGIVQQESEIINRLFDEGLTCLHIRKPDWDDFQMEELINAIHSNFHRFIKVHGAYKLCGRYNLGGIHLPEYKREAYQQKQLYVPVINTKEVAMSSSFHNLSDIKSCNLKLNYGFLSPVFTSISKENYKGQGFRITKAPFRVMALGGVTPDKVSFAYNLGYSGIAVLGYIWNQNNPVQAFKNIKEAYEKVYAPVYFSGKNT